jgi:hypothetical protein
MKAHEIDDLVREADPITVEDKERWMRSPATGAIRTRIAAGSRHPEPRPDRVGRRSRVRVLVLAAVALMAIGAAAATATILLGEPAPPAVKRDIAGVDAGFPADLRLNPDVANARSVASAGTSVLYFAQLKDGGHCTELVTSGVPRGAVCHTAQQVESMPVEVTIPFTNPVTKASPVTLGGRVNADGASSLEIRYGDGSVDPITLGTDGFFVFEVPSAHLAVVHGSDFELVALAQDGTEAASLDVPAVGEEPAGPIEDPAPITVDTISDGSDFTLVLGVRGRVNAEGAVSLEFRYPDGTIVSVTLMEDGSYDFDIPTARQGDLLHAPGTLIARDAGGQEVASVPVASVAFWRIHGG